MRGEKFFNSKPTKDLDAFKSEVNVIFDSRKTQTLADEASKVSAS